MKEILKAIQQITITSEDGFNYWGSYFETESFDKQIKTDNYWFDLKFEVTVEFTSMQEYKWDETKIVEFKVYDLLGNSVDPKITHEQVANNLNIAL